MVFSLIYKKQFFIFEREGQPSLSIRVQSLGEVFHCRNRLFLGKRTHVPLEEMIGLEPLSYEVETEEFQRMKEKSMLFLKKISENIK